MKTWQENTDTTIKQSKPSYNCKYCNKAYTQEKTLIAHQCEPKRRWMQEKEIGVQFGLQAYLRFYEITQGSAKYKSYGDFVESPFYLAFVRFGRHLANLKAVNTGEFIDFLIKNGKKIDTWTHEVVYTEYLSRYIKKEPVQTALERSLTKMQDYADNSVDLNGEFNDYFRYGNANRICNHILNGRISPWVIFNCDSGIEFLESLGEEQILMIVDFINPEFWQKKFNNYVADVEWIKSILKDAGL